MSATATIWLQGEERRARFARRQISEGATLPWGQIVPSLRVVAKIATGCVARLAHILDMGRSERLATDDFGHNASHEMIVNRPWPVSLIFRGIQPFAGSVVKQCKAIAC